MQWGRQPPPPLEQIPWWVEEWVQSPTRSREGEESRRDRESRCCGLKEFSVFGAKQVALWPTSPFAGECIEGTEAGFPHPSWRAG